MSQDLIIIKWVLILGMTFSFGVAIIALVLLMALYFNK